MSQSHSISWWHFPSGNFVVAFIIMLLMILIMMMMSMILIIILSMIMMKIKITLIVTSFASNCSPVLPQTVHHHLQASTKWQKVFITIEVTIFNRWSINHIFKKTKISPIVQFQLLHNIWLWCALSYRPWRSSCFA